MDSSPAAGPAAPISASVRMMPVLGVVIGVGALEQAIGYLARGGIAGGLLSPFAASLVILLVAAPLEEGARFAVGASALAAGMAAARRRIWSFYACIVGAEALFAAIALAAHPPGSLAVCLLAFVVLRAPPTALHAGWSWLSLQAIRSKARHAGGAAAAWLCLALLTHFAWDATASVVTAAIRDH